jgi:hypothetical protein
MGMQAQHARTPVGAEVGCSNGAANKSKPRLRDTPFEECDSVSPCEKTGTGDGNGGEEAGRIAYRSKDVMACDDTQFLDVNDGECWIEQVSINKLQCGFLGQSEGAGMRSRGLKRDRTQFQDGTHEFLLFSVIVNKNSEVASIRTIVVQRYLDSLGCS